MKTSIALLFALFFGWSFAQTAIISHKSHSGSASDFAFADPANYGGPPTPTIHTLSRLNDTVVVVENSWSGQDRLLIINNHELQDSLRDSVEVLRMGNYQLGAIMRKDTTSKIIQLHNNETPQQRLEQMENTKPKQQPEKQEKAATPHNRKSSLLYFGLILGASLAFGMLRKFLSRA